MEKLEPPTIGLVTFGERGQRPIVAEANPVTRKIRVGIASIIAPVLTFAAVTWGRSL